MLRPDVLQDCSVWRARAGAQCALEWTTPKVVAKSLIRLVLPYRHELLALPAELKAIVRTYWQSLLQETGLELEVMVCWSKAGSALVNIIRGRKERRR